MPALRTQYSKAEDKWYLIGNAGEPLEIADIESLEQLLEDSAALKADKLRLWCLQIPLPNIPPLVLCVLPITSKTDSAMLAGMEKALLDVLLDNERPLTIVSLGSDGTASEREARRLLFEYADVRPEHFSIPSPDSSSDPFKITMLCIHQKTIAIIQDPKHCRKTIRNNLFSGARLLVLGNYIAVYSQVRLLAISEDSPLYYRDVEKLDRQDDRAASRLFSASFLEYTLKDKDHLALSVLLFVYGDLVDAYENRTLPHLERIKMAYRAHAFKSLWKAFLKQSKYPEKTYFISPAADDITTILVDGLFALIYIYRDKLDGKYPLLPWIHGSEANEHVFGLLRTMVSDFTMLDVLQLIPKIRVRLHAACRNKIADSDFKRTASGYSHTYYDTDAPSLAPLLDFPSDSDIHSACAAAHEEACALWKMLGGYRADAVPQNANSSPLTRPSAPINTDQGKSDAIGNDQDKGEDDDGMDDTTFRKTDRTELQQALQSMDNAHSLTTEQENTLDECTYAAASLAVADRDRM